LIPIRYSLSIRERNVSESTVGYRRWVCQCIHLYVIMKRKFKQWWSTIPRYQQIEQSLLTLTHWTEKDHDIWWWKSKSRLGKSGRVKPFNEIPTVLSVWGSSSRLSGGKFCRKYTKEISMFYYIRLLVRTKINDMNIPWAKVTDSSRQEKGQQIDFVIERPQQAYSFQCIQYFI
jgi:hypothetical protein